MSSTPPFSDTREHLLSTGETIILGKSFSSVGLAEILASASIPKGSFYHYFASKEAYGVALLHRYFGHYDEHLATLLAPSTGSARERLVHYFDGWLERHRCTHPEQSCLAVKLAAEVSDLSEPMREELATGMQRIIQRLAHSIRQGQQDGSLCASLLPDETASALYSLWIGSVLSFKVLRSRIPLLAAMQQTQQILKTP